MESLPKTSKSRIINPYYSQKEDRQNIPFGYYSTRTIKQNTLSPTHYFQTFTHSKYVQTEVEVQAQDWLKDQVESQNKNGEEQLINVRQFKKLLEGEDSEFLKWQDQKKFPNNDVQPYGKIWLPKLSINIRSCQLQIVCAKFERFKAALVLVPYREGELVKYIDILFDSKVFLQYDKLLTQKYNREGYVYFFQAFNQKHRLLAFVKLHRSTLIRKQIIFALNFIMKNVQRIHTSNITQLLIPCLDIFEGFLTDLPRTVVEYLIRQGNPFKRVTFGCPSVDFFKKMIQFFMGLISQFSEEGENRITL